MTLSLPAYLGAWGTATLFWLGLLYQYQSKWNEAVGSVADDIRAYNARSGYDLSVDKEDLAGDFLLPLRSEHLHQFAENNGISHTTYQRDLRESVEKPQLRWGYFLHILGVIYTFSGISYLLPGGFFSPSVFLGSVSILFIVSLSLYFIL